MVPIAIAIGRVNTKSVSYNAGDHVFVHADVAGDTSYPTGGSSLTPAMLGLSEIHHVDFNPEPGGGLAVYDYANQKMKIFPTTFKTEATAASNQSGLVFRLFAVGKGFATTS